MLLESIELVNFRQFRKECIDFAQGENEKNITIIIGENGTGKTTFAQAFFWCMYGETEFSDKNMLNKQVASKLEAGGKEAEVKVVLKLKHGSFCYELTRKQVYKKDYSGKVKGNNTEFYIAKRDESGVTKPITKTTEYEIEVNSILPKELSRYFFFDGERIEKMSKEISAGKKASDFADAVKGLLGLNAMCAAIKHFNPNSKYSVIGSYENAYDSSSNAKIQEYTNKISNCKTTLAKIDEQIEELEKSIESASARKAEKTDEIKQYAEGKEYQHQKYELLKKVSNTKASKATVIKECCKDFNSNLSSFFSASLIKKTLEFLSHKDFIGKDIPYMHTKTIEYLLKQGACICGTQLNEGSEAYNKVKALIEFLPPQSISTVISDFKKEAKQRANKYQALYSLLKEKMEIISRQDDEITDINDQLADIEKKLNGNDVRSIVNSINSEIKICDKNMHESTCKKDKLLIEKGKLETIKERADSERRNLSLLDEKNKKIELYRAYAEKIYTELKKVYNDSEADIRKRLETEINNIFKTIYAGGLSLTIDEKYHISVYANDFDGSVETSTAQSIAVIFAFIAGIIKMARDNRNNNNEDAKLLSSEPYPLVMDAPLSTFDKRRIKTVCEALPATAEQIIIFIKDTDGELAEEYMSNKIGRRYSFVKINEFETVLHKKEQRYV